MGVLKERGCLMDNKVGVIIGRSESSFNELEMAVAFKEREKAPKLGAFMIVEEKGPPYRKLLCRVEDMDYGDFQTTKDMRQRALVEKYIREIEGYQRELSEEEKRGLFFRRYILLILGVIKGREINTDYRLLPELTECFARYPTAEENKVILSSGILNPEASIEIGNLAIGSSVEVEHCVLIDPGKFKHRRTAIFAQTGYGKTNLCKTVASLAALHSDAGILILDMNGEYAFTTKAADGSDIVGLCDIDCLKGNIAVYTERRDILEGDKYKDVYVRPLLNLSYLPPYKVVDLFVDQDLKIVREFRGLEETNWQKCLMKCVETRGRDLWSEIYDFLTQTPEFHGKDAKELRALTRNIWEIMPLHSPEAGDLLFETLYHLARKRVVVIDLSLTPLDQAMLIANLVLKNIFDFNVKGITKGQTIEVIAILEEAQNVLRLKDIEEGKTIFVRWAKEGRKFYLGLIYVTQQPGVIAEEIVSQTENYFVMHLLNDKDVRALVTANKHFGGVIAKLLQDETIIGNTYIYSAPYQPFVFPAKVFKFDKDLFKKVRPSNLISIKQEMELVAEGLKSQLFKPVDSQLSWPKVQKSTREVKVGHICYWLYEFFQKQGWQVPYAFVNEDKKGTKRFDFQFTLDYLKMLSYLELAKGRIKKEDGEWVYTI